jgi:aldose sugar dehydrogenase
MAGRFYHSMRAWVTRHRWLFIILVVLCATLYSVMLIAAGLVAGVVAEKQAYPAKLFALLKKYTVRMAGEQKVEWHEQFTNIHTLEIARIYIGNGLGYGGGLAEVAGNILFASAKGRFGYLDKDNRVRSLGIVVPMNLESLRKDPHYDDPLFAYTTVRVAGMLAVPSDAKHFKLYVSHHSYKPSCIQYKVSVLEIEADEQGIRVGTPSWQEVFVARPQCIPDKDKSWRFVGEHAGGRLVQLDTDHLLLTIGDHQFDGFNDHWAVSSDLGTDLGKIIEIDLRSRTSRIYAKGVRNPQGLTVARDGRIWETEHGPQGGDEINVIRKGADYGWPNVTYGMNYGYPRRNWPLAAEPGAHDGYTKPAFAFVPSIAISGVVEPDPVEFPGWQRCLIAGSLRAHTLFLLRTEDDRIVYAEPIATERDRIRDIISLRNGQLAYLSDEGYLVFIRNAERHKDSRKPFSVAGLSSLSKPFPEELPPSGSSPVPRGRHMYVSVCAQCHSLDGSVGAGPPLNGVVGRRVGSVPGYGYSDALAHYDGVWTRDLLVSYLTDPNRKFHGTTMPIAGVSWVEVPNIVSFLETTRAQ